ncbi:MAG: hypothetical protein Q7S86_04325 [bacterium]|nr:hypothetical protein [bacterium]
MKSTTDDSDDGGEAMGLEARLTKVLLKPPSETKAVCSLGLLRPKVVCDGDSSITEGDLE